MIAHVLCIPNPLGRARSSWRMAVVGLVACASGPGATNPAVHPVAAVTVVPAAATMAVTGTLQLSATTWDSAGQVLSGRAVAWTSDAPAVATVSPSGIVTAVAPGAATVTAASEGHSGAAAVTVTQIPLIGSCATPRPEWIWCDDFETDRLGRYFEYVSAGGVFARAAGVGRAGSFGMRAHWAVGEVSAGALHLAFGRTPQAYFRPVDAGTADYREIYWRVYVRNQSGWVGGGGNKLSRAISFASSTSWAEAMIAHVWSGGSAPGWDYLFLDPASGTDAAGTLRTTTYNDIANFRWLGAVRGQTPLFGATAVGAWHCVEAHVRLNDAGQANGVFELWVDGALDAQKPGLNWVGGFNAYGINAVFFENYWNSGSPADQERYFDDLVVSTAPIGC